MTPQEAWHSLRDNPEYFLRYYPLKSAGTNLAMNAGQTNLRPVTFSKLSPGQPGTQGWQHKEGHYGATRPSKSILGKLGKTKNISSFYMSAGYMPPGVTTHGPVQACYIPMVNANSDVYGALNLHNNLTAMPYYVADGTGDGLLSTGQLSGCCFGWVTAGADLYCVHVNPAGTDAAQLHTDMINTGALGGIPAALRFFGRNQYPAVATVVGVRGGGGWRLYAQKSADAFHTVSGLLRLHPNPETLL